MLQQGKRPKEFGNPDGTVYIVEGCATGANIYQATGTAVAVAFDAGNLKPVALNLKQKFPDAELIICADNDQWTDNNPGVSKARVVDKAGTGETASLNR